MSEKLHTIWISLLKTISIVSFTLKDFPQTRYQGSKRKIVLWINEVIKENNLKYNTVLDGFGGTGTVSYLFKLLNKETTYNDSLKFNHIIGKALIENSTVTITEDEINSILQFDSSNKLITNNFKGIYYLDSENEWIDNTIAGIENTFNRKTSIHQYKKAIAYYAIFQSCLIKRPFNLFHRNNLYIRTNDVPRNFGNKTTWEKPFNDLFRKFVTEANNAVFDNGESCKSLNESIFEIDPYGYDLVYFDPPYYAQNGSHETANYLRCYHFLEGIANYKQWEKRIDYNTPNLRLKQADVQSDFIEKDIYNKFEELIVRFRKSKIIFSYKNGGFPGIDFISRIMSLNKKKTIIADKHYKYALNHQNGNAKKNREVLIIGI